MTEKEEQAYILDTETWEGKEVKEAVFYYTCRQCGKTFESCRTGIGVALMHLTAAVLDEKTINGQRMVDRLAIHPCEGDDHGLADLVGYRVC